MSALTIRRADVSAVLALAAVLVALLMLGLGLGLGLAFPTTTAPTESADDGTG